MRIHSRDKGSVSHPSDLTFGSDRKVQDLLRPRHEAEPAGAGPAPAPQVPNCRKQKACLVAAKAKPLAARPPRHAHGGLISPRFAGMNSRENGSKKSKQVRRAFSPIRLSIFSVLYPIKRSGAERSTEASTGTDGQRGERYQGPV
jgi:hypothetical protein